MAMFIHESRLRLLDPKVKVIWASGPVFFALIAWIISWNLAALAFPEGLFGISSFFYPLFFLFMALVFLVPYLGWLELDYRNFFYSMEEKELVIRKGIFSTERIVIPFEKIQNVHVSRSLVEKIIGLATIRIETAGPTAQQTEGVLPGIGEYRNLIDEILTKVEASKNRAKAAAKPGFEAGEMKKVVDELVALREEVKRLRENGRVQDAARQPIAPLLELEHDRYKNYYEKSISPKAQRKKGSKKR